MASSTTGSSKSGQRPPHPEGEQPGEERVEPVASPEGNGKRRPGKKGAKALKTVVPAQPNPDEVDGASDTDEVPTTNSTVDNRELTLPTSKPADRGGPLAVTYADHMNEPLQPGMTADDQVKLIKARSGALNKTIWTAGLLPVIAILLLSGFMVVVYLLAPEVPVERMVGTAAALVLTYGAGRLIHNRWSRGGR